MLLVIMLPAIFRSDFYFHLFIFHLFVVVVVLFSFIRLGKEKKKYKRKYEMSHGKYQTWVLIFHLVKESKVLT